MINHSGYAYIKPRSPWRGSSGNLVVWRKSRKSVRVACTHSCATMLPVRLFFICPPSQPVFTPVCHNWALLQNAATPHLPLTQEMGQALAAYLQDGRPKSESRRIFLQ